MEIYINSKEGVTLNTEKKYCPEDITVSVETKEINITPSLEKQTQEGLFSKVNVDPITGDTLEAIPSTEQQSFEGVYTNITIPGEENYIEDNIKEGVSMWGKVGTFAGGGEYNAIIKNDGTTTFDIKKWITEINGLDVNNKGVSMASAFVSYSNLTKFTMINSSKVTNMSNMLGSCSNLEYIGDIDASNCTTLNSAMRDCPKLTKMPKITTTSKLTDLTSMFSNDTALTDVSNFSELDLSGAHSFNYLFSGCKGLTYIPYIALPYNGYQTNIAQMFYNCSNLVEIGGVESRLAQNIREIFYMCTSLKTIPELDCTKVNYTVNIFYGCNALENFGGLKDVGKGYYDTIANYVTLKLDFSHCTLLTHESLMNIINKVYDLNLTYGVATGGTLYPQMLVLGETNLAKLTADEIAVATAKRMEC